MQKDEAFYSGFSKWVKRLYGDNGPSEQVFSELIETDRIIQYGPADQVQLEVVQAQDDVISEEILDY